MKKCNIMRKAICFLLVFLLIAGLASPALARLSEEEPLLVDSATEIQPLLPQLLWVEIFVSHFEGYDFIEDLPNATVRVFRNNVRLHPDLRTGPNGEPAEFGPVFIAGSYRFEADVPGFRFIPGRNTIVFSGTCLYEMTMILTVERIGAPPPPPPPIVYPFTDVFQADWFADSVRYVFDNGIMTGTTPTTFSPNQNFTREQLTATLFRILHGRQANSGDSRDNPFTDVPAGHWSAPYVTWALNAGIVTGTSPTSFAPENAIARQDFATMLYRFAPHVGVGTRVPGNFNLGFPDAHRVGPWAQDAVLWAVYHDLLRGIDGNLMPQATTDRAQGATLLQRFEQDTR